MTPPRVIVQNNYVTPLTAPLAMAARDRGGEVIDLSWNPDLPHTDLEGPALIFGSTTFVREVAEENPHLAYFYNEHDFLPWVWRDKLTRRYLNFKGSRLTVEGLEQLLAENPRFSYHVRPAVRLKAFNGAVYDADGWRTICADRHLPADLEVWAATAVKPEDIGAEVRLWLVGDKVVAASQYRRGGEMLRRADGPDVDTAIRQQMEKGVWAPPYPVVVDWCGLRNGRWRIIEFNTIHTSGWYAADPGAVLDAVWPHVMAAHKR